MVLSTVRSPKKSHPMTRPLHQDSCGFMFKPCALRSAPSPISTRSPLRSKPLPPPVAISSPPVTSPHSHPRRLKGIHLSTSRTRSPLVTRVCNSLKRYKDLQSFIPQITQISAFSTSNDSLIIPILCRRLHQ